MKKHKCYICKEMRIIMEGDICKECYKDNFHSEQERKEFNLSEKEINKGFPTLAGAELYHEQDIKDFIRLFKEKMLLHKRDTKWRLPVVEYYKIIEMIDKLAGDKLI